MAIRRGKDLRAMSWRRAILLCVVVAALLVAGWATAKVHRGTQVAAHFPAVLPGLTEPEVVALLGRPNRVVGPRPSHWCDATSVAEEHASPSDRECGRQWQYDEPFVPACFSVCFGTDGRVRSTYRYVSP